MHPDDDIAYQNYCLYCLQKQYAPILISFSYGDVGCHHCGRTTHEMSKEDYWERLSEARARQIPAASNPPRLARPPRPRKPGP